MSFEIRLSGHARRQFKKLDRETRDRIAGRLNQFSGDPRGFGTEKLAGNDAHYRNRVGEYRIVFEIHDAVLVLLVIRVGHRREVYRGD